MQNKMESSEIILLAQLVDGLNQELDSFEKAYVKNDKKQFDQAKAGILEFQSKINYLLK